MLFDLLERCFQILMGTPRIGKIISVFAITGEPLYLFSQ